MPFEFRIRTRLSEKFLAGAARMVGEARSVELRMGEQSSYEDEDLHFGLVVGAILEATAALECEIYEVTTHGAPHAMASEEHSDSALSDREFLSPLAEIINNMPGVLAKFEIVLHSLRRAPMNKGANPWQDAELVTKLRNELVHYKSKYRAENQNPAWIEALRKKGHRIPSCYKELSSFFPTQCLNADCAAWAVRTCADFLESFHDHLGYPERLEPYKNRLSL